MASNQRKAEAFSHNISKIVVLGDDSVGKTSLICAINSSTYQNDHEEMKHINNSNKNEQDKHQRARLDSAMHSHQYGRGHELVSSSVFSVMEKKIGVQISFANSSNSSKTTTTRSVMPERVSLRLWELHDAEVGEEFLRKIFENTYAG